MSRTSSWSCGGYVSARGRAVGIEFIDEGVSGAKTRRPALDRLMLAARRRQIDAVVCWRLDRLGRDLAHRLAVVNEWTALGVAFISLGEGIDATTPAGALQLHILGGAGAVRARTPAGARDRRSGPRQARRAAFGSSEDHAASRGRTARSDCSARGSSVGLLTFHCREATGKGRAAAGGTNPSARRSRSGLILHRFSRDPAVGQSGVCPARVHRSW